MDDQSHPPRVPGPAGPPPQAMFASARERPRSSSAWGTYFVVALAVAIPTFFVATAMIHNPSDGGLNALNGIFAAFFAFLAFIGTLVVCAIARGLSR